MGKAKAPACTDPDGHSSQLPPPNGPTVDGECRICGTVREMKNSLERRPSQSGRGAPRGRCSLDSMALKIIHQVVKLTATHMVEEIVGQHSIPLSLLRRYISGAKVDTLLEVL